MAEVIVLQHAACEGLGSIQQVLDRQGVQARYVCSYAGERVPERLAGTAGLIVMGGPMSVHEPEQYPFLRDELRLIQRAVAERHPVLGVCLGSQLLATALGGTVRAGARKEIGWYPVRLTAAAKRDRSWARVPPEFMAFHWHGEVFTLPPGAVALASSELTPRQAFRYGPNAYGCLFHMEVTETVVADMVASFADELRETGVSPDEITGGRDTQLAALQKIGEEFFTQWTKLLGSGSR